MKTWQCFKQYFARAFGFPESWKRKILVLGPKTSRDAVRLAEKSDTDSTTVVRNAIRLYEFALEKKAAGETLRVLLPDGSIEDAPL